MDALDLQKPLLDGAIRSVNFFNGRLLTANDLTREQQARREADWRLAQGVGDGVAYGLEVTEHVDSRVENPLVTVRPGLAINRQGHTLRVKKETTVALVRRAKTSTKNDATFVECGVLGGGTYVAGPGVFMLTIAPAEVREGKALTSGYEVRGGRCNTDTIAEAVQFRLIQIDVALEGIDLTQEAKLRNVVAHRCFGTTELEAFRRDPFGADMSTYGLLDELRDGLLTDCDVPLAVVHWTLTGGIRFVDMWSVRRPVTRRAVGGHWSALADERNVAEGRAMFLQFQEQIRGLLDAGASAATAKAVELFAYLPPVGILPVARGKGQRGLDPATFFADVTTRGPFFIEGAKLAPLVRRAVAYAPIDLTTGELVWLYSVRENVQRADDTPGSPPQACLVFASGQTPYQADPRFDASRWDYANYTLR